jgi:hypothetical protein
MAVVSILILMSLLSPGYPDASRSFCDGKAPSHDTSPTCSGLLCFAQEFGQGLSLIQVRLPVVSARVPNNDIGYLTLRSRFIYQLLLLYLLQVLIVFLILTKRFGVEALHLCLLLHEQLSDLFLEICLGEHLRVLLLFKVFYELHVEVLWNDVVSNLSIIVLYVFQVSELLSLS